MVSVQPRPSPPSSSPYVDSRPRAVLSFICWAHQTRRDLRALLAQALRINRGFSEGYILDALENDASAEMGEPLLWFPVAHIYAGERPPFHRLPRDVRLQEERALGSSFSLLQGSYYEYARLTLILDKGGGLEGGGGLGGGKRHPPPAPPRRRNQLMVAYKSLEEEADPRLLAGWVRWSGAWEAYTLLQEKALPVSTIILYVREQPASQEIFKYVLLLEVVTRSYTELQRLRTVSHRLRVERWSGYTCVYTCHSLQSFTDNFASTDSITKIVGDMNSLYD
ncbi:uncharacterized protein LOC143041354 [Oratosquilla oratoria]|uniref:uncharacterized protein LOC143041354 n=1 Tax=Oratosquilla oratoria TaxID=337810 RepID=UPI003F75A9A0